MQVVVQVTVLPFIMYVLVYICALALIASVAKMIASAFFMFTPLLKPFRAQQLELPDSVLWDSIAFPNPNSASCYAQ